MNDKIDLKEMERRANRLLSQDGLVEILLGAILFVSSSTFDGSGSWVPFIPIYLVFMRNIIEGFRKRFTYPRIGYVKVPDEASTDAGTGVLKYLATVLVVLITGILLFKGELNAGLFYQWLPVAIGLFISGAMYYMYAKTGDSVNLIYIAVLILGAGAFSLGPLEGKTATQFYLLSLAGFFLVAGIARFLSFTRNNPVLEAPGDE